MPRSDGSDTTLQSKSLNDNVPQGPNLDKVVVPNSILLAGLSPNLSFEQKQTAINRAGFAFNAADAQNSNLPDGSIPTTREKYQETVIKAQLKHSEEAGVLSGALHAVALPFVAVGKLQDATDAVIAALHQQNADHRRESLAIVQQGYESAVGSKDATGLMVGGVLIESGTRIASAGVVGALGVAQFVVHPIDSTMHVVDAIASPIETGKKLYDWYDNAAAADIPEAALSVLVGAKMAPPVTKAVVGTVKSVASIPEVAQASAAVAAAVKPVVATAMASPKVAATISAMQPVVNATLAHAQTVNTAVIQPVLNAHSRLDAMVDHTYRAAVHGTQQAVSKVGNALGEFAKDAVGITAKKELVAVRTENAALETQLAKVNGQLTASTQTLDVATNGHRVAREKLHELLTDEEASHGKTQKKLNATAAELAKTKEELLDLKKRFVTVEDTVIRDVGRIQMKERVEFETERTQLHAQLKTAAENLARLTVENRGLKIEMKRLATNGGQLITPQLEKLPHEDVLPSSQVAEMRQLKKQLEIEQKNHSATTTKLFEAELAAYKFEGAAHDATKSANQNLDMVEQLFENRVKSMQSEISKLEEQLAETTQKNEHLADELAKTSAQFKALSEDVEADISRLINHDLAEELVTLRQEYAELLARFQAATETVVEGDGALAQLAKQNDAPEQALKENQRPAAED